MDSSQEPWFAVRCLIRTERDDGSLERPIYEERITLWQASSFDEAMERAESEARDYAVDLNAEYVEFAQAFHLSIGRELSDGAEVFSLMRSSDLPADEYIDRFFATGDEREHHD